MHLRVKKGGEGEVREDKTGNEGWAQIFLGPLIPGMGSSGLFQTRGTHTHRHVESTLHEKCESLGSVFPFL